MSAAAMLKAARKDIGLSGRPNWITRFYAARNGDEFLRAAWCDQSITAWAHKSGNVDAVLPEGDRAWTVLHAQDGKELGRWHSGTADNIRRFALPGAVLFFDWGLTNEIAKIDHVGLVEVNLGDGRVQSIEANTGDAVRRRVRGPDVIAGFWNPPYEEEDMPSADDVADAVIKRLSQTLTKDLWAVREGIFEEGDKLDPKTFIRQSWAYGKDGYQRDREIIARLDALLAAIQTLAVAIAMPAEDVDVDALAAHIEAKISAALESVTVRLDVPDKEEAPA